VYGLFALVLQERLHVTFSIVLVGKALSRGGVVQRALDFQSFALKLMVRCKHEVVYLGLCPVVTVIRRRTR